MSFENNWRRQQELIARPIIDAIYQSLWGDDILISRNSEYFDKVYGIDTRVVFGNGMLLSIQEKALSWNFAAKQTLTIEYMQNIAEQGNWFLSLPQLYFCGYLVEDRTAFDSYVLVNYPTLVLWTAKTGGKWSEPLQNKQSLASLIFIRFVDIPPHCVIASKTRRTIVEQRILI